MGNGRREYSSRVFVGKREEVASTERWLWSQTTSHKERRRRCDGKVAAKIKVEVEVEVEVEEVAFGITVPIMLDVT